jgi:hypothetical protein
MGLEGFLADFVSTLINDNERSDVGTRCSVPHIPMHDQVLEVWQDATTFYCKSYLAWLAYVDLLMSALSSSNSLFQS